MPNLDPITGFPIPADYGNDGLDKFTAGMALANPISGWSDRRFAPNYKADVPEERKVDYDPWADQRIDKYDPMHFVDSQSEAETTNMIEAIERNMALQKRSSGIAGVAGTVTGVFSNPLIMLPAIATSGGSIPAMMAAEVGGELLSESLLHSQQPLRTKMETALNTGFATVGAGLGGYIQKSLGRSAPREATDTAHGGDGMYAHPIPEEARTGYVQPSREFVEGAPEGVSSPMVIHERIKDNLNKLSKLKKDTKATREELKEKAQDAFDAGNEALGNKYLDKLDIIKNKIKTLDEEIEIDTKARIKATKEGAVTKEGVRAAEPEPAAAKVEAEAAAKIEETLSVATKELNIANTVLKKANAAAVKARAKVIEMGCQ